MYDNTTFEDYSEFSQIYIRLKSKDNQNSDLFKIKNLKFQFSANKNHILLD